MTPESSLLHYAPAAVWYRRWPWRRIIVGGVLLCVVSALVVWWEPMRRQSKVLYHQRRCLNYSLPEKQVVYEEDPAEMGKLLAMGTEYEPFTARYAGSSKAVIHRPACLKAFDKAAFSFGNRSRGPVLFLHELKNKNGMRRLVCVTLYCDGGLGLTAVAIDPAGWTTAPKVATTQWEIERNITDNWNREMFQRRAGFMRFYAGQVAKDDPAAYYIDYVWNGKPGRAEGRLDDQGNVSISFLGDPVLQDFWVNQAAVWQEKH